MPTEKWENTMISTFQYLHTFTAQAKSNNSFAGSRPDQEKISHFYGNSSICKKPGVMNILFQVITHNYEQIIRNGCIS